MGNIQKDKLPDISALSVPGTKDEVVKMFRNGDKVEAHQVPEYQEALVA